MEGDDAFRHGAPSCQSGGLLTAPLPAAGVSGIGHRSASPGPVWRAAGTSAAGRKKCQAFTGKHSSTSSTSSRGSIQKSCCDASQEQILNEVARVAHKPMDRFSHDLRAEQDSKTLAFEILGHTRGQHSAPDRYPLLSPYPIHCSDGNCRPGNAAMHRGLLWMRRQHAPNMHAPQPQAAPAEQRYDSEQQGGRPEDAVQALLLRARSQMELVQVMHAVLHVCMLPLQRKPADLVHPPTRKRSCH